MRALILYSDKGIWEGLFIDGELIYEDHNISERGPIFWLDIAENYGLKSKDIMYKEVVPEDDKYLEEHGSFPKRLDQLRGKYQ